MHTQLSAVAEPHGSRADYWNDLISSKVIGMDLRFEEPLNIRNEVLTGNVGPVHVTEALCSPGEATRTTRHIRENDPDSYTLVMHKEGMAISEHRGRRSRYRPGDLGLMDFSHPLHWTYTKRRMVLVSFPKALSPLRRDEMGQLTGQSFPGTRGAGALVSTLVRQLPRHLETGEVAGGARIGCAVLDLVNAAFAAQLERKDALPAETRTNTLLLRCRSFIEEHLDEPELRPGTIAAAHHISLRYLHRIFEPTGEGVAALIRRRRLDRCRSDLLDAGLADRSVAAVGARWGLTNAAHFNRLFKSTYGLPPAEFRAVYGASGAARQ